MVILEEEISRLQRFTKIVMQWWGTGVGLHAGWYRGLNDQDLIIQKFGENMKIEDLIIIIKGMCNGSEQVSLWFVQYLLSSYD